MSKDDSIVLKPQQVHFLSEYTDPNSDNFGNAYQSALAAGYKESYAENITTLMPEWLLENIGDMKMLRKAERNLNKALDININDEKIGDRGLKATLFALERLNKKKYSNRTELTGADGESLTVNVIKYGGDNNTAQV